MKKILLSVLLIIILSYQVVNSQTLVASYPLPYYNPYNFLWGITGINDYLWCGSDYYASTPGLYKISKTGVIVDSMSTPFDFNHGLAWDGSGFWIAQDYSSSGAKLYKINMSGQKVDSIMLGSYAQGVGGLALDGNNLWFSVYYPDNPSYPFAYAYKVNLSTKQLVDTIPLRGKQVYGIAVKGDTILYVNTKFQGELERIYAYRKSVGDTLFSFAAPDPDNDCDPRGLFWDNQNLWLLAYRVGNNINQYRTIYKYALTGSGSPVITTSTNLIDFGNILINGTGTQSLTINNLGTAKLIISGKNITNPRFGISPNNVPDTILPGQFKNYNVTFSPLAYGYDSTQLQIQSNDFANPNVIVRLKGKGVYTGAFINLSALSYEYGQRRTNSLCGYIFTVMNQGNTPLQINSMNLNTSNYRIDTLGLTFPVSIDTQKTKQFRVWFHPTSPSSFTDTLKINSNAVNLPLSKISLSGSGISQTYDLGSILWQGIVPDNPYTSYNDYQPVSIKQIADVNGDGFNDMLVASNNYLVSCFNGNSSVTSDVLWTFNSGITNYNSGSVTNEEAMQIRDDIDGDGIPDIVIGCGGGNEMVYTISGRTGQMIWSYGDSINYSDGDITGVRVDKDYNGDGVKDVIVSASGNGQPPLGRRSVYILNGINGNLIFQIPETQVQFLTDVANNQLGGAVGLSNNGGPYFVQGFNNSGSNTWSYTSTDYVWNLKEIKSINSDTIRDFACFAGFNGKIFTLNGATGAEIWSRNLGSSINGTIKILQDSLHNNLLNKLYTFGPKTLQVVDPVTSNVDWVLPLDNSYILGVCQLNYYHLYAPMIVATTLNNHVYACNTRNTGSIVFTYSFGSGGSETAAEKVSALKTVRTPDQQYNGIADDFIAGCRDGRIVCFSGGYFLTPNVNTIGNNVPDKYSLEQNYPNPFNPVTKIKFAIPKSNDVKITIYDISGRVIKLETLSNLSAGIYEYTLDASSFASGTYFYKLQSGGFSMVKKMLMIK
jgi:hypothetical protein